MVIVYLHLSSLSSIIYDSHRMVVVNPSFFEGKRLDFLSF